MGYWQLFLTFWGIYVQTPMITPIDMGSKDPLTPVWEVRNSLWFDMHEVQIANLPGPMEINTQITKPDISKRLTTLQPYSDVCERLLNFRDFRIASEINLAISVKEIEVLRTGKAATFTYGGEMVGPIRLVQAVGVSYRPRLLGVVRLPRRRFCQEFETARPDGITHLVPY